MATKNIVCMKWGTLYDAGHVNKLYAMARRNTSGELRFVCLTDAAAGIWPAKSYKKLYKHSRPATWINDHWHE